MGIDHDLALAVLQSHPNKWVRPATNAKLLSYLLLALKGYAVAVRDEDGYLFHLTTGHAQPLFVETGSVNEHQVVALAAVGA